IHPGDLIQTTGVEGRVEKVGFGATYVRTEQGLMAVPNHLMASQIITLRTAPPIAELKRPAA
ncbi:MAG: mechanosensitive ion channel, partial [Candidatus Sericytochromatia bacterium]|nr:mechanosensitive ion channel [Candidatus Sericytochromatia bacterium]